MAVRTRPLPLRKSHGTAYNLSPGTERVAAERIRIGDVVMEDRDHPATVTQVTYPRGAVCIRARYIWQRPGDPSWILGTFPYGHAFDRALPGEY